VKEERRRKGEAKRRVKNFKNRPLPPRFFFLRGEEWRILIQLPSHGARSEEKDLLLLHSFSSPLFGDLRGRSSAEGNGDPNVAWPWRAGRRGGGASGYRGLLSERPRRAASPPPCPPRSRGAFAMALGGIAASSFPHVKGRERSGGNFLVGNRVGEKRTRFPSIVSQ